jgi:hypothetical protein
MSAIDPNEISTSAPTAASVAQNFTRAHNEINDLLSRTSGAGVLIGASLPTGPHPYGTLFIHETPPPRVSVWMGLAPHETGTNLWATIG